MAGKQHTSNTGRPGAAAHLVGEHHETLAANFLGRRGLRLLQRNFRCRGGEIDLIMRDGETVVFVEVRFRRSQRHGGAGESITMAKQRRLWRCANFYLLQHQRAGGSLPACRFDVVAMTIPAVGQQQPRIDWLINVIDGGRGMR